MKELALNQINAGSKVVFQVAGACGLGVISAGMQTKTQVIGVDADQGYLAPTLVLTSAEKRVNTGVFAAIKDLKAGKFSATSRRTSPMAASESARSMRPASRTRRRSTRSSRDEVRKDQASDQPGGQVGGRRRRL